MENCSICNLNYKKAFKSDHLKSVKHLEKLNQYYCKKCYLYMPISDKSSHLNSDEHKNRINKIWCEDCSNIYLIQQDISKVKFIYKTVNKTVCKASEAVLQISVQLCCPPVME